jgi:hypothetical protein
MVYTLNMDVIIYDVYSTFTNMWILSKMIDTVVKCKILRDDSPEFRRHTGIGYRFVEVEKDRKL